MLLKYLSTGLAVLSVGAAWLYSQSRESLDVQRARTKLVSSRARKVFYTNKWNLDDVPEYRPKQRVSGTIREWGDNYFGDSYLNEYWERGFHRYQPDVKFEYNMKTALIAVPALSTGVADLAPSRLVTFEDLEGYQRVYNCDPLEVMVATGSYNVPGWSPAFAIVLNKANPLSKLTLKQLDGIFGAARTGGWEGTTWHPEVARTAKENIRTWGQLRLTGEWKNKPIHVYGLNLRYEMTNSFQLKVFQGGDKWNENMIEYANYAKPDGSLSIAAQQLMVDLSKDPYGIGYSGIMFLTPQTKAVALASKDGGPYYELNIENVRNRTYPLCLEVYFYIHREPGKPIDPKLKEYVRYTLSREGQEAIVRDGKYLPLTGNMVKEELKKLDQ
jgi:phosphate transport system substrate-binding protein